MNAKAGEHRHSVLCRLDVTISARYDWSVGQLTPFPRRHWNFRNLTLQQECYLASTRAFFRTFARLYNAAASPYRCRVLWIQKTDFNLNNIIATLSLISISSVKNSPANVLTRTQTWSQIHSSPLTPVGDATLLLDAVRMRSMKNTNFIRKRGN